MFLSLLSDLRASSDEYSLARSELLQISKDSEPSIQRMGLEKMWFSPDLNQAVFLRSKSLQNLNVNLLLKEEIIFTEEKMAYVGDLIYFYNFTKPEIEEWLKSNKLNLISTKTSCIQNSKKSPFVFLISATISIAQAEDCNKNPSTLTIVKNSKWFNSFTSFVSGDSLKQYIGCAANDPKFEKDEPMNLKPKEFAHFIKDSWEQIKSVVSNLDNLEVPPEIKKQLSCEAFMLGIMIPQNALLSSTGVGAPLAAVRMFNAVTRLLKSVKYLSKYTKAAKKLVQDKVDAARLVHQEKVFNKQIKTAIKDSQKASSRNLKDKDLPELQESLEKEYVLQKVLLQSSLKLKKNQGLGKIQERMKEIKKQKEEVKAQQKKEISALRASLDTPENRYKAQSAIIKNSKKDVNDLMDKIAKTSDPKKKTEYFEDIQESMNMELTVQREILKTAEKLNKKGEISSIQNRIKELEKVESKIIEGRRRQEQEFPSFLRDFMDD